MSERGRSWGSFGVSVALHLAVALLTWNERLLTLDAAPEVRAATDAVELTFEPPPPEAAGRPEVPPVQEPELPRAYVDVPERMRSEEPPARADFLALVDSRAADLVPGGEDDARPRAPEEADLDQVFIRKQDVTAEPGIAVLPPRAEAPAADRTATAQRQGGPAPGLDAAPGESGPLAAGTVRPPAALEPRDAGAAGAASGAGTPVARGGAGEPPRRPAAPGPRERPGPRQGRSELADLLAGEAPSLFRDRPGADPGDRGFDFDQPAVGREGGNVSIEGGYRLNTIAWDYAPWMQRFGQDLRRNWTAPYAYRIGVIDGNTKLRVVVERDGTLSALEVLEEIGHASLRQASESALRAAAPFAPLPPGFPEENLEIILTLYYPAWRTPSPVEQPPADESGSPWRGGRR